MILSELAGSCRTLHEPGNWRYKAVTRTEKLIESIIDSALPGLASFAQGGTLELPVKYRLAFRELGLAIGLAGAGNLYTLVQQNPDLFGNSVSLKHKVEAICEYMPLQEAIIRFWTVPKNRESPAWTEHEEISMVMLATSLEPDGFLTL